LLLAWGGGCCGRLASAMDGDGRSRPAPGFGLLLLALHFELASAPCILLGEFLGSAPVGGTGLIEAEGLRRLVSRLRARGVAQVSPVWAAAVDRGAACLTLRHDDAAERQRQDRSQSRCGEVTEGAGLRGAVHDQLTFRSVGAGDLLATVSASGLLTGLGGLGRGGLAWILASALSI